MKVRDVAEYVSIVLFGSGCVIGIMTLGQWVGTSIPETQSFGYWFAGLWVASFVIGLFVCAYDSGVSQGLEEQEPDEDNRRDSTT